MLRRAFASLLPTVLALAFLCGTPGTSIGGPEASAAPWTATAAATPIARGGLTQDMPEGVVSQRADEDDTPDDRVIRVSTPFVWPDCALQARTLRASDRAGRSHRPCAAPPRAPPTA